MLWAATFASDIDAPCHLQQGVAAGALRRNGKRAQARLALFYHRLVHALQVLPKLDFFGTVDAARGAGGFFESSSTCTPRVL
eukprot:CAMPEP_0178465982 /NCGR_PEP_ID=MMETSP0689_2-20121128/51653_1 /TAXON_ID=160604 /ORGANISM="Amphidinium massartii, Strain CS-259" /LENGTH=81 /DNA_ID=CAMNT_0020092961 /DNA_START=307 /DNA_END=549 /DNA_ORIENTATION=-